MSFFRSRDEVPFLTRTPSDWRFKLALDQAFILLVVQNIPTMKTPPGTTALKSESLVRPK